MAEKNEWVFADLESVTVDEYDEFVSILVDSPKVRLSAPYLVRWIVAWPYEGDPSKEESYGKLKLKDWKEAARQTMAAFRRAMAS